MTYSRYKALYATRRATRTEKHAVSTAYGVGHATHNNKELEPVYIKYVLLCDGALCALALCSRLCVAYVLHYTRRIAYTQNYTTSKDVYTDPSIIIETTCRDSCSEVVHDAVYVSPPC